MYDIYAIDSLLCLYNYCGMEQALDLTHPTQPIIVREVLFAANVLLALRDKNRIDDMDDAI